MNGAIEKMPIVDIVRLSSSSAGNEDGGRSIFVTPYVVRIVKNQVLESMPQVVGIH
jgi:hypothetical protein